MKLATAPTLLLACCVFRPSSPRPVDALANPAMGEIPRPHAPKSEPMALRVIHLNVHRFTSVGPASASPPSTVGAVGTALAALQPDLVTLNEVDTAAIPDCLESVAESLALPHVEFFGHVRGTYGNAILSRYPLRRRKAIRLDGGTEYSFPAGTRLFSGKVAEGHETHRIVRGLLVCDVELPPGRGRLGVAVTHLDHMDVAQRRTQMEHIVREEGGDDPLLLMGDLNALNRSDYDDGAWGRLEERHRSRGWQLPQHGDLSILRDAGFEDVVAISGSHPQLTAPAREPLYRIDYGWLRRGRSPVAVLDAAVCDEIVISDHLPLVLNLRLPGEAEVDE